MIIIYFSVIITDEIEVFIIYLSSYTYFMRKIFLFKDNSYRQKNASNNLT